MHKFTLKKDNRILNCLEECFSVVHGKYKIQSSANINIYVQCKRHGNLSADRKNVQAWDARANEGLNDVTTRVN